MQNIETKVRCADLEAVRGRLRDSGADDRGLLVQTDTYFHAASGRLKLREIEGGEAELIGYVRPDLGPARISDYDVLAVSEPEKVKRLLRRTLGLRGVVRKRRELWLLGNTRVHLDQVEGLGTFVELETVVGDRSPAAAREEFERAAACLGVEALSPVPGSYIDLLRKAGAAG